MNYAAIDYESYWDDECGIGPLGTDGYILSSKFDAYLVSIITSTGLEWVGHPSEAPWSEISGDEWEWLAHNASFDQRVHYYLQKWCRVPSTASPRLWNCTADLCAFSAAPRSLANAANYLYNEKVSKTYRDKMKGKIFSALTPEQQEEIKAAGLVDARTCLRFFNDLSPKWPEHERRISRLSRQQAWHGLRLDLERMDESIHLLKSLKWTAEQMIPWQGVEKNLSYDALCMECQKVGISAPPSTAMSSEECEAWENMYGDKYPWIDAMRTARRANAQLKKLETMRDRVRESDGRMPYANKYFGAHTGRWGDGGESAGRNKEGGFNSRNMPRKEMFGEEFFFGKQKADGTREEAEGKRFASIWIPGMRGVNLRECIIPAEGCHFPIADLAQIEPRVLWALAGDADSLAFVRQGMSTYEVHARATMGYDDPAPLKEVDPAKYQLSKARVLALGYQAGWLKFITMAKMYVSEEEATRIFSAPVSDEAVLRFVSYLDHCRVKEWLALWNKADAATRTIYVNSWLIVSEFRRSNPKIVKLWRKLQRSLDLAVGDDLEIGLPSGRSLMYRKIAKADREITGVVMKYGKPMRVKLYGGLLAENATQAIARDVFVECLLRLDDAGHHVSLHSHDEAVPEVPLFVSAKEIQDVMSQSPAWMKSLPVASECESHLCYTK